MSTRTKGIVALLVMWIIASAVRLSSLGDVTILGDAIHPWWAALRSGLPRPHASPYGWALVMPYKACLIGAGTLYEAVGRMAVLHALVAPIAAWLAWRMGGRWTVAASVGLIAALDPGLVDTFQSGAEGYLAPVWVGLVCLALSAPLRWGSLLAAPLLAVAVMHHPLAVAGLPLLVGINWRSRRAWAGGAVAAALLVPRVVRGLSEALPGASELGLPELALGAYLQQGGPVAWVILAGPFVGLVSPRTRDFSVRVIASMVLLGAVGVGGGYLRDHHIRIFTAPALAGWAAVPWPGAVAVLMATLLRPDGGPATVEGQPGSLRLTAAMVDAVEAEVGPPALVDGAWLSGGPAASPGALMLDLHLRGWRAEDLNTGGSVVVVVSGTREDIGAMDPGGLQVIDGMSDRHGLLVGQAAEVRLWSSSHCQGNLGGAWDALSALHADLTVEQTRTWWACP